MSNRAGTHRITKVGRQELLDLPAGCRRVILDNQLTQWRVQFVTEGDDVRLVFSYPGRKPPCNPHEVDNLPKISHDS